MTYDPGKILPNLTCMNCGFVGLMQIVGGGAICNQYGWIKNYGGCKPGFPNFAAPPQRLPPAPRRTSQYPLVMKMSSTTKSRTAAKIRGKRKRPAASTPVPQTQGELLPAEDTYERALAAVRTERSRAFVRALVAT